MINIIPNSNNLFIPHLSINTREAKFSSQSPLPKARFLLHGDDEKNHRKKLLINYDDIEPHHTTPETSCSSSTHLKKLTQKMTQSTEADNMHDSLSFYQIIHNYYEYNNGSSVKRDTSPHRNVQKKKSQRLYTEQSQPIKGDFVFKTPQTSYVKQRQTISRLYGSKQNKKLMMLH